MGSLVATGQIMKALQPLAEVCLMYLGVGALLWVIVVALVMVLR